MMKSLFWMYALRPQKWGIDLFLENLKKYPRATIIGNTIHTIGDLPAVGSQVQGFEYFHNFLSTICSCCFATICAKNSLI